ncbi:hypothetical protein ECC02_009828 [Trypanosoma cruzi]|uniref:Mucin TcMUCII n=1 Tax=Trypanosoma cruzi TaxID=5693 RepID=A0A7J6XS66_TRYCR|nr:hypothetical protein ECC02_009828 [Trypanosoma cruzi]
MTTLTMMTTCRLLCALLVLALCCCPSVCVADAQPKPAATSSQTNTTPVSTKPESSESAPSQSTSATGVTLEGTGQPESSSNGSAAEHGNTAGNRGVLPSSHPQSSVDPNTVQREDTGEKSGTKSRTRTSADQTDQEAKDAAATTTTTTKAPTTTTTTTTTTTAPEAPSTTTTEAPAVSSTRAPSRLREIDGSLSSSAWVCATLVLAASALAYTTVG